MLTTHILAPRVSADKMLPRLSNGDNMKAGILVRTEHLVVGEVPDPELERGSVIIRVRACSICGTDLRTYRYGHPRVKLPQILGHEIAGEVEAVSGEVVDCKVGDRVAITPRIACGECYYCTNGLHIYCQNSLTFGYDLPGGYADCLAVPLSGVMYGALIKIADGLSFEEASLAEPLSCCLRAQRASQVGRGDTVVVIGGGPVGIMHCRMARVNGAGKIILIEKETKRLRYVDLAAVTTIIDSSKSDPQADVIASTGGGGADVVIVACPSTEAQEQALSMACKGGRINFFGGFPTGQSTISVDSNLIHYRELTIQGSHGSAPSHIGEAIDMLARKDLDVSDIVTHTFPLDSIETAFHFAEKREGMRVTIYP